jgi:HAMP domain-containing protein/signal transduction histidine kinase/DNA-binding response OmpR family regulator
MANGKQNGELKSARRPSNGKSTARSRNGSVVLNRDVAAGSAQMVKLDAGGAQLDLKQLLRVLSSVKKGDFTVRLETEENGMVAKIAETLNDVIELNERLTKELERISSVVGKEGKITQRAALTSASGGWDSCVESVNMLITDLAQPTTEVARVIGAVAKGDLSQTMALEIDGRPVKGEFLRTGKVVNTMVDQLSSFAAEVTRVAREVGTEGKLGGQAVVKGVSGTWKDLTDNVNFMASNLTSQMRNIANVTTAVANGDLSKKITVDVKGEFLELKSTINTMVDQLNSFASEVTRVAREVGTEGKLGGQAQVKGASGTWKDLTDNVNFMAGNLTSQMRNIADVTTAVANGDLSKKITVDVKGEFLELKNTINTMVDQLSSFASEVTRVAREVGTEGKLGGQAEVKGVSGTWKDLTDNVNFMAGNLTSQMRNIADVTTAVANGDLSKKITVDVKGEFLELKSTINTMVDQLSSFASEVTRVAREVGTEGKLGGQAEVKGVSGTWKDLTDNVNFMANNLTSQVRNIAKITTAVANGDLSKKITVDVKGEILELKNTVNTMVDQLNSFASEVTRVAREVGTEGKLGGQAEVKGVAGTWKDLTDNVNFMANNLTSQVRNIAKITTAVANGDLSKKITVDVRGEILELKNTVNTMVDQLNSFASEVTRVAREVGTEGKLGGQAEVRGVAGVWKDLTDNVNLMAANLTAQVRGIARVVTAVANGNLKRKLAVEAMGEIAELADTINSMIDTLATFADQVTTVAREVGIEGKLGGQAMVPGASGTWRDLTDNVNRLAANLTTQVRAMAEVATAVTKGDLTRSITVEAAGEVAYLKDNVNEMIRNLKDTTHKNTEQDWLKTNLATFTRLLQGQKDLWTVSRLILSELGPLVSVQHGVFYITESLGEEVILKLLASYAYKERKNLSNEFKLGEGLVGQCALEKERILVNGVPNDYIKINSGLGESSPLNIVVLPVLFEGQVKAVIELASFHSFNDNHLALLDQLTESIGIVLNTIEANMRTESLLAQSQSLTQELQSQQQELTGTNRRLEQQAKSLQASEELLKQQQEELQQTNEELEEKAQLLSEQKTEVEQKNREIELARRALEDKAEQLALTSKYKSEFLANMSHELRTPLNSMLILSKMLSDNIEHNLTPKQVEFAETIHSSGTDLFGLINEILDMSKIESGTMPVEVEDVPLSDIKVDMERTFSQLAQEKQLEFGIELATNTPSIIRTDSKRIQQVLKNLLSNAFKFTDKGKVTLSMALVENAGQFDNELLNRADQVIAFSVTDTGIGIPKDKHRIIFEPFQQADGTTSRNYGGTGLGLSISREIARLLGGEIKLTSVPGAGSTFALYLPQAYTPTILGAPTEEQETALQNLLPAPVQQNLERVSLSLSYGSDPSVLIENQVHDDQAIVEPGDRTLLIVEDDPNFARILLEMARDKGFKGIVANRGETALLLARRFKPDAITLDIQLPGMHGLAVLDRLKHDPTTRHIPVHIVSVSEEIPRSRKLGALAHIRKPVTAEGMAQSMDSIKDFVDRPIKRLLIVEDDEVQRNIIQEIIGDVDINIVSVGTGEEALKLLKEDHFDCTVLDLGLPDMTGFELIEKIRAESALKDLPVVVYTGRDLSKKQAAELNKLAEAVIVKGATSIDRLLDETALFLHRVEANLPEDKRRRLENMHHNEATLAQKKVLVVDDDIRNIFALTSILERHQMEVVYAENGKDGIEFLHHTPGIEAVLMDVMMPGMDGYEAMRTIRKNKKFKSLPIIAVTAKAMKGDREKCIEAGASDYITKPVDVDQLLSLLRIWMYK